MSDEQLPAGPMPTPAQDLAERLYREAVDAYKAAGDASIDGWMRACREQQGKLTIEISNPSHLSDSENFSGQIGKRSEFRDAFMRLIFLAASYAVPQRGFTIAGDNYPPRGGREVKLRITPDLRDMPSFAWGILVRSLDGPELWTRGMHGGLIFHRSEGGTWNIHT